MKWGGGLDGTIQGHIVFIGARSFPYHIFLCDAKIYKVRVAMGNLLSMLTPIFFL